MEPSQIVDLAREPQFALGSLLVLPSLRLVRASDGTEQRLEPRAMKVLITFVRADGAILSRDDLIRLCWDGRAVSHDAVERVVAQLRRLGNGLGQGSFAIETVAKVGYRLRVEAPAPAPTKPAPAEPPSRRRFLVAGGALGIVGLGAWLTTRRPSRHDPLTIAVQAFDAFSTEPSAPLIARGLAREIRNSLARVGGLRVIADSSSFSLADPREAATAVGRKLGAELLVQGGVVRQGDALRVNVALVEVDQGTILWSSAFADAAGNLLQLQERITGRIVQELAGRVGPERERNPPLPRQRDPMAFRSALSAQQLFEDSRALRMAGKEEAAFDAADQAFRLASDALAIDDADGGALLVVAGLTRNGWTRAMAAQARTPLQRATAAVEWVRRALLADPNDPGALAALGDHYRRYEWRWQEAENLLRKAMAIDPSLPEAHWSYAYMLGTQGRGLEGLDHARKLVALDPLTSWRRVALPRLFYLVGQDAEADRLYARELAAGRDNLFLIRELYFMHLTERNGEALRRLAQKVSSLWQDSATPPGVAALLGRIDAGIAALAGRPQRLLALVDADVTAWDRPATGNAATQQGRASVDLLYVYAMEYGWTGQVARALDLLERALAAYSLYWPATLPFGRAQFPEAVRREDRYRAMWMRNPRLKELLAIRRRAVANRQSVGFLS